MKPHRIDRDGDLPDSESEPEPHYGPGAGWAFIAGVVVLMAILIWSAFT